MGIVGDCGSLGEDLTQEARAQGVVLVEVLGSFCNLVRGGEGKDIFADCRAETDLEEGIRLQCFQLLEATMEGTLDAGLVSSETVEFNLKVVVREQIAVLEAGAQLGFHAANAAEVPRGGDQLIEQGLLNSALGFDFDLEIGEELLELLVLAGREDDFSGGETVLACILRGVSFAFLSSWSGGMLSIGRVGGESCWGSRHG